MSPAHIRKCATLALLLEATSFKPGNISPYFESAEKLEHYIVSSIAIGNVFERCNSRSVGRLVYDATKAMLAAQRGGNTHLGAIILLAPLAKACLRCVPKPGANNIAGAGEAVPAMDRHELRTAVGKIVSECTSADTLAVYDAIVLSRPAGLTPAHKFDVRDPETRALLSRNDVALLEFMAAGADYNLVCSEFITTYEITFNHGVASLINKYKKYGTMRLAVTALAMEFLAKYMDNMIMGTRGKEVARHVMKRASLLLKKHGELEAARHMHDYLVKKRANPGAIADIISSTLFVYLVTEGCVL